MGPCSHCTWESQFVDTLLLFLLMILIWFLNLFVDAVVELL